MYYDVKHITFLVNKSSNSDILWPLFHVVCNANDCKNGGSCVVENGLATCSCTSGRTAFSLCLVGCVQSCACRHPGVP